MTFTDEQQADIKEIIKATLEVELPIILKLFAMQHEINDQVKIAYEKIDASVGEVKKELADHKQAFCSESAATLRDLETLKERILAVIRGEDQ